LGLPEEVCRKIFAENFIRLAGDTPRKIDEDLLRKEEELMKKYV
jgi:hypothetical protein